MEDSAIKDASPYPSQSDMDLDMWRALKPNVAGHRPVGMFRDGIGEQILVYVPFNDNDQSLRDAIARRIECIGDLYEALRRAAERMIEAGMDVSDEHRALSEFVNPKPFAEGF